jgi:peptidylprolyl isomerase
MAGRNRDRQRAARRQAALAAAREAERAHARRRRLVVGGGLAALAAVAVLLFLLVGGGNDKGKKTALDTKSTDTTAATPTTAAAATSAKGKPCVALADPLPQGAPAVPVEVGPPPTNLVTKDLVVGTGATVGPNDTVTAHYIGVSCSTGKIFDSSWSRGQPIPFSLNQVIDGWKQGIPGMKVGGRRLLGIPSNLAYGASGQGALIGPDEALWFVVDVVDTKAG